MSQKSTVFTGELFTKSESKTEDLISMIGDIQQKYTHTYYDADGNKKCFERKILSGDNKTEKNSHHGILRYLQNTFLKHQFRDHIIRGE